MGLRSLTVPNQVRTSTLQQVTGRIESIPILGRTGVVIETSGMLRKHHRTVRKCGKTLRRAGLALKRLGEEQV